MLRHSQVRKSGSLHMASFNLKLSGEVDGRCVSVLIPTQHSFYENNKKNITDGIIRYKMISEATILFENIEMVDLLENRKSFMQQLYANVQMDLLHLNIGIHNIEEFDKVTLMSDHYSEYGDVCKVNICNTYVLE